MSAPNWLANDMKTPILDLSGATFGYLTALEPTDIRSGSAVVWKCICAAPCNKIHYVSRASLTSGGTKSCGCRRGLGKARSLAGQKFGPLTAIEPTTHRNKHGAIMWLCQCESGHTKLVATNALTRGRAACGECKPRSRLVLGVTMRTSDMARVAGVTVSCIEQRLGRGMSPEQAIAMPNHNSHHKTSTRHRKPKE
jgi:hypothetical protein